MCGICGFCDFTRDFAVSEAAARRHIQTLIGMREAINYRGEDEHGEYLRKNAGLAHARLSIRDIANGKQPMIRRRDGREFTIVFNGEIYNTAELSEKLRARSCFPETTCDTEIILLMYMEYGEEFISLLNGIFAFVIYDGARERLVLARDNVGVKPLFYSLKGDLLVFGSEIKALFKHPEIRPKIGRDGFREIFALGPARTPGCGVFEGVREIKPGHYAVLDRGGFYEREYWALTAKEHRDSYDETVEKVGFLVRDAITRQMVSDVPVCSFLSGGVDSSIVTAVACQSFASPSELNTFSFDFAGNDRFFRPNSFQPERDNKYVDIMLRTYPTNHSYLQCAEAELEGMLREATFAKDLPGMADVDASMLYFCRIVSRTNKVVLTGECADEIFGGYPWFYRPELTQGELFPWSRNMDTRKLLLNDGFAASLELDEYARESFLKSAAEAPLLDGESAAAQKQRRVTYLNIRWFMQTLLDRMDRASMHTGLEARVPFADKRIVEYLYNVPWEMKYRGGVEKSLLREAFRGVIPDEVLFRKKSPYPKTYDPQYEKRLGEKLKSILSGSSDSPLKFICDEAKLDEFLLRPSEYGKPWFGQLMSSPQLLAYFIQLNYWFEIYKPEICL